MILFWECVRCGKMNHSLNTRRHEIDMCECGLSGVDLEKDYCRYLGDVRGVNSVDYDFYEELMYCVWNQKFRLPIKKSRVMDVYYFDTSFLKDLEDEMIKEMYEKVSFNQKV